ncbi:MAG: hypothetical protein QM770_19815 [Tepidisphaeraceae bacterium]
MDWFGGLIFIAIVLGTLGLLVLAGRWDRRSAKSREAELLDLPAEPIDRAVHRRESFDPIEQAGGPRGPTYPVASRVVTPPPEPAPAPTPPPASAKPADVIDPIEPSPAAEEIAAAVSEPAESDMIDAPVVEAQNDTLVEPIETSDQASIIEETETPHSDDDANRA